MAEVSGLHKFMLCGEESIPSYRDLLFQSSQAREKCRIHCIHTMFLSLYYHCSLMIIACYLLPLPQLRLLCLSQYHNKQTSESMKSTATTKMSDKRIISWNTYFMCIFFALSFAFSLFLLSWMYMRCPNMAFHTISYFLYDNVKNNVNNNTTTTTNSSSSSRSSNK